MIIHPAIKRVEGGLEKQIKKEGYAVVCVCVCVCMCVYVWGRGGAGRNPLSTMDDIV